MKRLMEMNALLDAYGSLLTKRQYEVMCCYYEDDLSLGEIAENFEISRSAVNDLVKRSEAILLHYEEHLHLVEKSMKRFALYDKIKACEDTSVQNWVQELERLERE